MTKTMPERINAIKLISYDTQQLVEMLMEENDMNADQITLEMVMNRVKDWVDEDFTQDCANDVIYQDENGREL